MLRDDIRARALVLVAWAALAAAGCGDSPAPPDAGCAPGTAGCACLEGAICQGGLACDMGLCRGVDLVEIEVTDVSARACELVLVEEGTEVLGVDFAAGTRGTSIHESPRTAVTFHREDDTAFAAGAITVRRTEGAGGMLEIRRARCFDREGSALAGEPVRITE